MYDSDRGYHDTRSRRVPYSSEHDRFDFSMVNPCPDNSDEFLCDPNVQLFRK